LCHWIICYSANYLIDLKVGVIVDSETTPARRTEEVEATKTMIERTEARFGLKPDRLATDTAYGSASTLVWLVNDKAIEPHVPVWDICHETVRYWWNRFGPMFAREIRKKRIHPVPNHSNWKWHPDEVSLSKSTARPIITGVLLIMKAKF
jgi:hypothetical protein